MTLLESATRSVPALADTTETGALGVYHLKRLWSRMMAARAGGSGRPAQRDRQFDTLVIHALGLGLEQTLDYLGQRAPTFADFERWIAATTGGVDPAPLAHITAAVYGVSQPGSNQQ